MPPSDEARTRLGPIVRERRLHLGLAYKTAAKLAGMSKETWKKIEDGEIVRAMSYAKVDPILEWAPGSCEAVLAGRQPIATKASERVPGVEISERPREDIAAEARDVVSLAMIATTSGLTAEEIRALSDRAVRDLQARGLI